MESLLRRPWFFGCVIPMVIIFGIGSLFPDYLHYFALVPANTLITHTYTWNLLTAPFVEINVLKVALNSIVLWKLSDYMGLPNIEQFGLFFVFSILACTLGASVCCFIRFAISGIETSLVTPLFGLNGIIICFMMYARLVLKDQSIIARIPSVTFHQLPLLHLTVQNFLRLVGFRSLTEDILFAWIGFFFSWSYLRFYYKDDDVDGEIDFTFVGMFPETFHSVLIPFTTSFQILMAQIGIFPVIIQQNERRQLHHLRSDHSEASEHPSSVQQEDAVAERRRAKAMKILDAKLAELSKDLNGWDDNSIELSA